MGFTCLRHRAGGARRPTEGEVLVTDLEAEGAVLAEAVERILADSAALDAVGAAAAVKARSWSTMAHSQALMLIVREFMHSRPAPATAS
jgi:hypothetical protein